MPNVLHPNTVDGEHVDRKYDNGELFVYFCPTAGWYIEGLVPRVPEDNDKPGWVCFDLDSKTDGKYDRFGAVAQHLWRLGIPSDQIIEISQEF